MEESSINSYAVGNSSSSGNLLERSPFANFSDLSKNIPPYLNNPFTGQSTLPGGINPFASDGNIRFQQLIFDRLQLVLGDNFFESNHNLFIGSDGNTFNFGQPPFNESNAPVGNGNRDFGTNNATIGNFNTNYSQDSATIGNGNWNFNRNNTTIGNGNWKFGSNNTVVGNGNWYWDDANNNATLGNGNWSFSSDNQTIGNGNWHFGKDNLTVGNGNWYWDGGNNNKTLGNGNWQFGRDNQIIGNGNWDFGSNNTIIGNGNLVFTSGNTIVGNGNLLVEEDNTIIGINDNANNLDLFAQTSKNDVESLINYLVGNISQDFIKLTTNFDNSETQMFYRLMLSRKPDDDHSNVSNQFQDLFRSLFSEVPINELPYQPINEVQSVPEPTLVLPLIIFSFLYLLFFKLNRKVLPQKTLCRKIF